MNGPSLASEEPQPSFIVTYRTQDGARVRTQVEGVSVREVRACFRLASQIVPGTLAVQERRS